MSNDTKRCACCKAEKPLNEFHISPAQSDGRHSWCKACYNAWRRERKRAARLAKYDQWIFNDDGKICPMCGERKPLAEYHKNAAREHGIDPYCKACTSVRRSENRRTNPELYRMRGVRHYNNGGKERGRRWVAKNRELTRLYNRRFYHGNRDKHSARMKQHYIENKGQYKARRHYRRAMEKQAEGHFTNADLEALYDEQNGRCAYCGISIFWKVERDIHVDHIMPLSRGGTNGPENLALTCQDCNLSKGAKTLTEWRTMKGW